MWLNIVWILSTSKPIPLTCKYICYNTFSHLNLNPSNVYPQIFLKIFTNGLIILFGLLHPLVPCIFYNWNGTYLLSTDIYRGDYPKYLFEAIYYIYSPDGLKNAGMKVEKFDLILFRSHPFLWAFQKYITSNARYCKPEHLEDGRIYLNLVSQKIFFPIWLQMEKGNFLALKLVIYLQPYKLMLITQLQADDSIPEATGLSQRICPFELQIKTLQEAVLTDRKYMEIY